MGAMGFGELAHGQQHRLAIEGEADRRGARIERGREERPHRELEVLECFSLAFCQTVLARRGSE